MWDSITCFWRHDDANRSTRPDHFSRSYVSLRVAGGIRDSSPILSRPRPSRSQLCYQNKSTRARKSPQLEGDEHMASRLKGLGPDRKSGRATSGTQRLSQALLVARPLFRSSSLIKSLVEKARYLTQRLGFGKTREHNQLQLVNRRTKNS